MVAGLERAETRLGGGRFWRRFFLVAGLWNLSGALPSLLAPSLNLQLFYGFETDEFYTLFLNRGLWWAVLIFGIGYLIASQDPARHRGIIVMGVLGKIVIALHWFHLFAVGKATLIALLAGLGDSLFTAGFLAYLFTAPPRPPES